MFPARLRASSTVFFAFMGSNSAGSPRNFSHQTFPPAPVGEIQGIPWAAERSNLYSISQVCPGVSSQMDMPETPPQGGIQELSRPDAIMTPLTPLHAEEHQL